MNKKKFALFLGMLSGDGCLSIKHNGKGYRDYAIQFYNTDLDIVKLFKKLFLEIFSVQGNISIIRRVGKKDLFSFVKYSKQVYNEIKVQGFPEGIKKDILRIPKLIFKGTELEKRRFILGFLITDGCLRKRGDILFHSGSKNFLKDLSKLISSITGIRKPVRGYHQREKYFSYQLNLNKNETKKLFGDKPSRKLRNLFY